MIPVCFSHLARIDRQIDRAAMDAILDRLALDPIAEVRGTVQDARDDFETFLDRDELDTGRGP
jgi:hypothetical protein